MPKINLEGRSSTPDVDIRNVDTAFDPEARQAQQDWLDYLKQRPYLDSRGNIHSPENGRFMSVDMTDDGNRAYYDQIARETLNNTSREGLGVLSLARLAREARLNGDKTMLNDILDEVQDKLVEMKARYDWDADSSTTHFDKVMSIIYDEDNTGSGTEPAEAPVPAGATGPASKPGAAAGEQGLPGLAEGHERGSEENEPADNSNQGELPSQGDDSEGDSGAASERQEIGAALKKAMYEARALYLEEAAKMQKTHWYGVRESRAFMWLKAKFPKIADKVGDALSKPQDRLEELGRQYEAFLGDYLRNTRDNEAARREYLVQLLVADTRRIVALQRQSAPKPMSKWLRRAGYAAAGVAGGLAAFGGLGVALGAGIAGAGALAIRGRANKRNANAMVRDEGGHLRSAAGMNANMVVERFKNSYENPTETQFIGHLNEMTDKEVQKNRRRMLWPLVGAVGVALATKYGADFAYSWMTPDTPTTPEPSPGNTPDNTTPTPETSTSPEPKPEPEPTPQEEFISGQEFVVEPGKGYTHELMDFASVNGKNLSPEQAFDLHNHLVGQFGADYIDIGGPSGDIYTDMGDYRLTQPGAARWADGVVEEAKRWMTGQGLW